MPFDVEYSPDSLIQLESFDKLMARRIVKKIESTKADPYRYFKRLIGRPESKLRVGDYRVIAEIDEKEHKIFIRSIGHRRDVYRKH